MSRPGFFGKLPSAGDFVARGITPALQKYWDGWITREILATLGRDVIWPEGGLRFAMDGLAGVAIPSSDRAGRQFPMTYFVQFDDGLPKVPDIDIWIENRADLINASLSGDMSPDELHSALETLTTDSIGGAAEPSGQMLLWRFGGAGTLCDPARPTEALRRLLLGSNIPARGKSL